MFAFSQGYEEEIRGILQNDGFQLHGWCECLDLRFNLA